MKSGFVLADKIHFQKVLSTSEMSRIINKGPIFFNVASVNEIIWVKYFSMWFL